MSEAAQWRARASRARALELAASPIAWIALALAIALAVLATDRSPAPEPLPQSFAKFYEVNASAYAPASVERRDLAAWSFDEGAPKIWTAVGRVFAPRSGQGVSVRTGSQPQGYQLVSPPTLLEPGTYRILVQGHVDRGGISVGALDPDAEAFLASSNYWSGQRQPPGSVLATAFRVDHPRRVRVTLSNWAPVPSVSLWTIGRVAIQRLPEDKPIPLARNVQPDYIPFYRQGQSSFVRLGNGEPTHTWDFALQLPKGWAIIGTPQVAHRRDRFEVTTTQSTSAYQLVGPPAALEPGTYTVAVKGRIVVGGMQVGVIDAVSEQWVRASSFWSGQTPAAAERLGVLFTLERSASVRIVLANWAPEPNSSSWSIERIQIKNDHG